ncbi:hypothetical protein [Ilumatobacter nonamiensis]|uniref:hypothetical protein n=1 Tax=Ilumatobacter nonamiensis TaxID=467093 RepID=UPI00034D2B33|nr:hypothetical protein [Ilumatobacter nonamiensis]
MRWDSSRPVPWQRLMREWLIYVAIMAALLAVFFRDAGIVGALAGLLVSGPLYLLFGFVMAKLGYQRKSLKEMRTPQASSKKSKQDKDESDDDASARRPPAPTKRTSGGGNRPKSKSRRR